MSLDYTSMDDEHKLIARYAARLAAEAKVVSCIMWCFMNLNSVTDIFTICIS